jgi:hypothetical protein
MTTFRGDAVTSEPAPMMIVFDGTRCLGFIIRRGREGFQALNADGNSIGKYHSATKAADEIRREAAGK